MNQPYILWAMLYERVYKSSTNNNSKKQNIGPRYPHYTVAV